MALLDDIQRARREGGPRRRVHIVHGVRFPWNLYAGQRLTELAREEWFTYTPAVSDDPTFPGRRGLVGNVAAELAFDGRYHAMVCGSPNMVAHSKGVLESLPKPPESIRFEEFAAVPVTADASTSEPSAAQGGS